jgi:hypothetical protein
MLSEWCRQLTVIMCVMDRTSQTFEPTSAFTEKHEVNPYPANVEYRVSS